MATTSEKLQIILELVTGQYRREAGQAAQATGQIAQAAEKAGLSTARLDQAMTTAGRAMVGFGAAAVGSLGLAAKAAIDWESAFAGVRKTVEASEPEFAALEQGLLDMSLVTPVAAEGLASIAEAAGQLGIKNENILEFTETMAALGVTTNLTADEAASAFARIANILQVPQDQFDEMGSTVVELGNKSEATESEIVEFATRIAGAGKIAGLSAAKVFAIGAAFSSVGIEAEAGGTAVQKVLLDMTESVATGGGNLETFARVSGKTAQEFITLWQDDSAEAFTLFVEGLGRAGDDAFAILQELGLEDQRLIRSFLSLAGAGDLLRDSIELGNEAFRDNTALTKEAEERYATVASELQILVNAIKVLAIEIGNTLLPAIRAGADVAQTLVKWFTDMPEPIRIAVVALTGLVGGFTLLGGAALIIIPKIAATARAIRDLRLAILALRAANIGGAIGGAAAGTGAGAAGAAGAAAAGGAAAGLIVGAVALEKQARSMETTLGGYPKLLYDVAAAAEWLGLKIREATGEVDDLDAAAKNMVKGPQEVDSWANTWMDMVEGSTAATDAFTGATEGIQRYGTAASIAAGHARAVASAQRAITQALLEAVNPAANAAGAIDRLNDAQARVAELAAEGETGTREFATAMLELAVAKGEAQAALDSFDASGAAAALARIWDVPIEQAYEYLELLGLVDDKVVTTTIITNFVTRRDAQTGAGGNYIGIGGSGRQHGGPVWSGQPYMVGERGPELFVPQQSGAIVPNSRVSDWGGGGSMSLIQMMPIQMMSSVSMSNWSGGSRSVTFNLPVAEGPVKPLDLQYMALLANHMTLLD